MRNLRADATVLVVFIAVVTSAFAEQSVVPYAASPNDPYSIRATVSPEQADHGFTVQISVTEKKSGSVAFAPRVHFGGRMSVMHAEAFSDPVEGRPQFEVVVNLDATGKASITFQAFEHLLQASSIQAVLKASEPPSK